MTSPATHQLVRRGSQLAADLLTTFETDPTWELWGERREFEDTGVQAFADDALTDAVKFLTHLQNTFITADSANVNSLRLISDGLRLRTGRHSFRMIDESHVNGMKLPDGTYAESTTSFTHISKEGIVAYLEAGGSFWRGRFIRSPTEVATAKKVAAETAAGGSKDAGAESEASWVTESDSDPSTTGHKKKSKTAKRSAGTSKRTKRNSALPQWEVEWIHTDSVSRVTISSVPRESGSVLTEYSISGLSQAKLESKGGDSILLLPRFTTRPS